MCPDSQPLYTSKKPTYHEAVDETKAAISDGSSGEFVAADMSGKYSSRDTHSTVDYIDKYRRKC